MVDGLYLMEAWEKALWPVGGRIDQASCAGGHRLTYRVQDHKWMVGIRRVSPLQGEAKDKLHPKGGLKDQNVADLAPGEKVLTLAAIGPLCVALDAQVLYHLHSLCGHGHHMHVSIAPASSIRKLTCHHILSDSRV